jgi:starch synthase
MKILFLAAESAPLAKVGGLGDVAGDLPRALQEFGVDVRLFIPFYRSINRSDIEFELVDEIFVDYPLGNEKALIYCTLIDGIETYLIDGEPIDAVNGIYSDPKVDAYRFTFFSLAALQAAKSTGWKPDILHAHDWHTSIAVVWLNRNRDSDPFWKNTASLLTVHNLPYMGAGGESALDYYGIEAVDDERLPGWARHMSLPMGLATADWINTVSPAYAQEIQTPEFGHGLEVLITDRKDRVSGILNGLDLKRWDPTTDEALPKHFKREELNLRQKVRFALLETLGLDTYPNLPLLAMITRLDHQKGVDLTIQSLSNLTKDEWQFILLGTGDPNLEAMAKGFESDYPDRVRSIIRYDDELARNIYAGADMMLIPSRYEPCGLTQMISMRYGCVPVVAATGGLKDTVTDYASNPQGTGFVLSPINSDELSLAIRNALTTYRDKRRWRGLQRRGMNIDFSWRQSARRYIDLYQQAHSERSQN